MRFSRVLVNFLLGYALLHIAIACVFLLVLSPWLRGQMLGQTRQRLLDMAYVLREDVGSLDRGIWDPKALAHLETIGADTGARFTLIANDGTVAADSRTGRKPIGDHGQRPEVQEARRSGIGYNERVSATLGIRMMYLAIPLRDADEASREIGFVRVAVESESVRRAIFSLQTFVWVFTLSLGALAGTLMIAFAAREMRPLQTFATAARDIASGDYDRAATLARRNDEWKSLADAFAVMQTELAHRERRLSENNLRLEAVLASMIEGVLATDPMGVVILANQAACEMLGLKQSDLVQHRLLEAVRIPEFTTAIERVRNGQPSWQIEFETMGAPRRTLSVRVMQLASNPATGLAMVLHDVTELRQLETMRKDFVANVSHELKTPLSSVKAYAETLRLGAINDPDRNLEFVQQIESQAELLDRQIGDLLHLSRVESGHAVFDIAPVELRPALSECQERFTAEAKQRHVTLDFALREGLLVMADREALRTILDNLVSNAIRYAKSGGKVEVTAASVAGQIEIKVVDDGIGIAPEHHTRIFERFYRVDKARSREVGGTGLGLSVVKHTLQALGGSIELHSRLGQGSTFLVRLAAAPADAGQSP